MKTLLVSLFYVFCFLPLRAEIITPSAQAPDFIIKDNKGVEHQLYQYLSQGKSVILNFSSTWCKPCWNYKESGILDRIYSQYGPEGSDEVVILFLESDLNTSEDCLYGQENCNDFTYGNWASNSYPTSDLDGENSKILDTYNVTRFPSIYAISARDLSVKHLGQLSLLQWKIWVSEQRVRQPEVHLAPLASRRIQRVDSGIEISLGLTSRIVEDVATLPVSDIPVLPEAPSKITGQVWFQAYPNPCHQKLFINIENPSAKTVKVSAYDFKGKKVFRKNAKADNRRLAIDIRSVKRGTYMFVVESENQSWSKKIFIID